MSQQPPPYTPPTPTGDGRDDSGGDGELTVPTPPGGPVAQQPATSAASPPGSSGSSWLPMTAVGVAALVLGMIIGATGFGLINVLWHHGQQGRGDDRGWYWQDDRGRRPDPGPLRPDGTR